MKLLFNREKMKRKRREREREKMVSVVFSIISVYYCYDDVFLEPFFFTFDPSTPPSGWRYIVICRQPHCFYKYRFYQVTSLSRV